MGTRSAAIRHISFDAPGGRWHHAEASPPCDLADVVLSFWEARGFVSFGYEKFVPRGSADLIFNLSGPQRMYRDGDVANASTFRRAWIAGVFDRPLFVGPAYDAGLMGTHLIAVNVAPAAIPGLFGLTPAELRNQVVEAEDVFGNWIRTIWQRLGDAPDVETRFEVMLTFVRECRERLARPTPFDVRHALRTMTRERGNVRVETLARELGVSRRHLGSQFRASVGFTPKAFARLARFRATMARLNTAAVPDFADLAVELGYSDQAHLINEFRAFAGDSPRRFLALRAADGETVLYDF